MDDVQRWQIWSRVIDLALSLPPTRKISTADQSLATQAAGEVPSDAPKDHPYGKFYITPDYSRD
jgi:hypothetical protein